jgi:hypothetical protein
MPDIRRQQKTPAEDTSSTKSALHNQHYKAPPNTQQRMQALPELSNTGHGVAARWRRNGLAIQESDSRESLAGFWVAGI